MSNPQMGDRIHFVATPALEKVPMAGHPSKDVEVLDDLPGGQAKVAATTVRLEREKEARCPQVTLPLQRLWQPNIPFPLRLRHPDHFPWWERNAPQRVLNLIQQGVGHDWPSPDLGVHPCRRSQEEEADARVLLQEYLAIGAVQPVTWASTKFLIPWFLIKKQEGGSQKVRMIADCRQLNKFLEPAHFRLDHWGDIFPYLRKGMWGAKVDLKHAYFHLHNSPNILPHMRINVGDEVFSSRPQCLA